MKKIFFLSLRMWLMVFGWCTSQTNENEVFTRNILPEQLLNRTEKAIARETMANSVKIIDYAWLWTKKVDNEHMKIYLIGDFREFGLDKYGDIIAWWGAWRIPFVLYIKKNGDNRMYEKSEQASDGNMYRESLYRIFSQEVAKKIEKNEYVMYIQRPFLERAEKLLGKELYTPFSWSREPIIGKRCEININKYLEEWAQEFKKTNENCIWWNGIDYTMIFSSGGQYQDFLVNQGTKAVWKFSGWTGTVLVQEYNNSWSITHQKRIRIIESTNDTIKIKMDIF